MVTSIRSISHCFRHRTKWQGKLPVAASTLRRGFFLYQQQEHQPDILSLRATDAEGVVRYGRGVPSEGGPKNSDREYFIRARDESPPWLRSPSRKMQPWRQKIVDVFGDPASIADQSLQITISIGIAVYPINGDDDAQEQMKRRTRPCMPPRRQDAMAIDSSQTEIREILTALPIGGTRVELLQLLFNLTQIIH